MRDARDEVAGTLAEQYSRDVRAQFGGLADRTPLHRVNELASVPREDHAAQRELPDDLVNFIFDGGVLDERAITGLRLVDNELRAYEFCDESQAKERLRPYVWRRVGVALEALTTGQPRYLQDGYAP